MSGAVCICPAAPTGIYAGQEEMKLGTRYVQYAQGSDLFCSGGPVSNPPYGPPFSFYREKQATKLLAIFLAESEALA